MRRGDGERGGQDDAATAGTEQEPLDAGAQDGPVVLVTLEVEHAHAFLALIACAGAGCDCVSAGCGFA
jgi:hypothetical protein